MKTKHCEECRFFHHPSEIRPRAGCQKGHKPRFYAPKNISKAQRGDYGWKRKCEDFEIHPLQELVNQGQEWESG